MQAQEFKTLVASISSKLGVDAPATDDAGNDVPEAAPETNDYTLVQSMQDLTTWIDAAMKAGIVAVDTETDALDSMRAGLVGVSLCITPGKACYIPLGHVGGGAQGSFDLGDPNDKDSAGGDTPPQIPLKDAIYRAQADA